METQWSNRGGPRVPGPTVRALPFKPPQRFRPGRGVFSVKDRVPETGGLTSLKELNPKRRLSSLHPTELNSIDGGQSLAALAAKEGNMTVLEARPLLHNRRALESISKLMNRRANIRFSDFVKRTAWGSIMIDPAYKDEDAMNFLAERHDVSPGEVTTLRNNVTRFFRSPRRGKIATRKVFDLLRKRPDIRPHEAVKVMGGIIGVLCQCQAAKGGKGNGDHTVLGLFDSVTDLLTKRGNLHPDRVGDLIKTVNNLVPKDAKNRDDKVANGTRAALKVLKDNPERQPGELVQMAKDAGKKGGN